jgi:ABC-type branched-subunit amino acid transport system substrate-binding protein
MKKWTRWPLRNLSVVALSVLLGLSLFGCSSSKKQTASPTTAPSGSSSVANGTPVHVVSILDEEPSIGLEYPTLKQGFTVAADWINHHGGLGGTGHPVDVSFCDTDLNPNGSRSCATQAASSDAVATVGNILNYSNIVDPILQAAGMASIAPQPYSTEDGISPISFPINDAYLVTSPAMAAECLQSAHATRLSLLYVNVPAAAASRTETEQTIKTLGGTVVNAVGVAIGTADLSPYVAKLLSNGTDGVAMLTDPSTAVKATQEIRAEGPNVAICGNIDAFTPATISSLGSASNGLYVSTMFATNSVQQPGVQTFVQAMSEYGSLGNSDDFSKQAWAAIQLLNQACKGLTSITRQTVLSAMNAMTTWNSGGLLPIINFKTKGTLLGGTVPKYNNPGMFYAKVVNGQLVPTQGDVFYDPFTGKAVS